MTKNDVTMPGQSLGIGGDDVVGAECEGPPQIGGSRGVVDRDKDVPRVRRFSDQRDVTDVELRVRRRFEPDQTRPIEGGQLTVGSRRRKTIIDTDGG
jgi:hypothetical protein